MAFTATTTKNKQKQTNKPKRNQPNQQIDEQTNKQTKMKQKQSRSKLGVRGDVSTFLSEPFIVVGDEVHTLQNNCFFIFILENSDAQNYS